MRDPFSVPIQSGRRVQNQPTRTAIINDVDSQPLDALERLDCLEEIQCLGSIGAVMES